MAVRIALQCAEDDARLVFADDNPAARLLSRPGEAIYNASNGLIEGNTLFQCAWLDRSSHETILTALRVRSEATGIRRESPLVVFEGNALAEIAQNRALAGWLANDNGGRPLAVEAWLGEPVALRPPLAVGFRRQSGNNLLIVGRNAELASGMLSAAIVSIIAQDLDYGDAATPALFVLHFGAAEVDEIDVLPAVAARFPDHVRFGRRRHLEAFLEQLGTELERRSSDDAAGSAAQRPVFLVLSGLHAARDLVPDDGMSFSFGMSDDPSATPAPTPAQRLSDILRLGPELGMHTIMWSNTMAGVERTLDRRSLREIALRVALQMSAEDSSNLIDSPAANKLGPNRALLFHEDEGAVQKFRPYGPPPVAWLEGVQVAVNRRTKKRD